MEPINVFVSLTYRNTEWKDAAIDAITRLPDFAPVLIKGTPATNRSPRPIVQDAIAQSDVVVLIVDSSRVSRREESFTKFEYQNAKRTGKPVLVFLSKDVGAKTQEDLTNVTTFRHELIGRHEVVEFFKSSDELRAEITQSLLRLKQERFSETFNISFDPELTDQEVQAAFRALADFYRACGGTGLAVEFEREESQVRELSLV
jgi:GTPase Era involved in 16S rRNA processing